MNQGHPRDKHFWRHIYVTEKIALIEHGLMEHQAISVNKETDRGNTYCE